MAVHLDVNDFTALQNFGSSRPQQPESDGISIAQILNTIWRRRWVFASCFVGLTILGFVITKLLTPTFTGTAMLILSQKPDGIVNLESSSLQLPPADAVVRSQSDALQSRTLIDRVIDDQDLMDDPEFNIYAQPFQPNLLTQWGIAQRLPSFLQKYLLSKPLDPTLLTPDQLKYNVASQIIKHYLDIETDTKTYTVKIDFSSVDSAKAARIANAFANYYLQLQMDDQSKYATFAASWLDQRLAELSQKVADTGAAVAKFRAQNNIIDYPTAAGVSPEASTLTLQQIQNLQQSLAEAHANRSNLEAAEKEIQQVASNPDRALSAPVVATAPVVENLREQEVTAQAHLAELKGSLGANHPQVMQAKAAADALRGQLVTAVRDAVNQLSLQLAQARGNESQLQTQLTQLTSVRQGEVNLLPRLEQLEADQAAAVTLYNTFAQGYNHALSQDGVPTAAGRIIQYADPEDSPDFPNMLIFMAIAVAAAGMIAVALVFVLEARDKSFHTVKQLETGIGLPVLGLTLEVRRDPFNFVRLGGRRDLPLSIRMLHQPHSVLTETVRLVRTAITFSHASRPPKVVMVTSAVPREGKTTFSLMMARISAASGKRVLAIEGDLRRPSFTKELREGLPAKGLADYLTGQASIDDIIGVDKASGAHFIVARGPMASPSEALASPQMAALIEEARQRYDLVILDSPPATLVSDPVELGHGGAIDGVVLLVKWNSTPAHLVEDAVNKLRATDLPVLGTVLTQVNQKLYASFGEGQLPYHYGKKYYA